MDKLTFYKEKNVFITGHTGFKGTWLCKVLTMVGANITGYALEAKDNFFEIANVKNKINNVIGDIRDLELLKKALDTAKPEIVFHLAAQPIVRVSYENPVYTYETNVMGTVNILECIRNSRTVKSFLNVTTDKVYRNNEWEWGYREDEYLDGFDPYSNSKSCSELITHCYQRSFFENGEVRISTARAGNVIGGGDTAKDRIIPDCIRAVKNNEKIIVRNENSIRPFQHVLDPIYAYLMIAQKQYENEKYSGYYNVGPNEDDCITVGRLVTLFCNNWGNNAEYISKHTNGPHEAGFLKLDCSKIKKIFGWKPTWNIEKAVEKTVEYEKSTDKEKCMERQINEFLSLQ